MNEYCFDAEGIYEWRCFPMNGDVFQTPSASPYPIIRKLKTGQHKSHLKPGMNT